MPLRGEKKENSEQLAELTYLGPYYAWKVSVKKYISPHFMFEELYWKKCHFVHADVPFITGHGWTTVLSWKYSTS